MASTKFGVCVKKFGSDDELNVDVVMFEVKHMSSESTADVLRQNVSPKQVMSGSVASTPPPR